MPNRTKQAASGKAQGKSSPVEKQEGSKPKGLQQPLRPSKELAAVVGAEPLPRPEVVRKVWEYIKQHDLQNPKDRREIVADAKLELVFGKKKATMFEMNRYLAQHLT